MSKTDTDSSICKFCEYTVCLGFLNNLRILPYKNSFCEECLDKITDINDDRCIPLDPHLITCLSCQMQQSLRNREQKLRVGLLIKQMLNITNKYPIRMS